MDYTEATSDLAGLGLGVDVEDADDMREVDRMLRSITADLGQVDHNNIPQQAAIVLKTRLSSIRHQAELQFNDAVKKRIDGLMAIRNHRNLLPLLDELLGWRKSTTTGRYNPYKQAIQQLSDEEWWGLVLAWCWYRNGGIEPKDKVVPSRTYNMIRYEFQRRSDVRSDIAIAAAIGCSKSFIASSMLLLIHDLCANVDSVRKIPVDADRRNDFGLAEVHWIKPRSKAVLSLLDGYQPLVAPSKVVRVVRRATRHYRKVCLPVHGDNLFLHHYSSKGSSKQNHGNTVRPMTPSSETCLKAIKEIISIASNGKWSGTGKSVRISILLYEGMTGGLDAVQRSAQHRLKKTSQAYANKSPVRLSHDQVMREFKLWLEALVTVELTDVPRKLGIDDDEYKKRKQEVLSSRFGGIYCRNAFGGVQPGTTEGDACGKVSKCLTCKNRRNLFVASENNLVHLLHWNEALIKAKEEGIIDFKRTQDWLFWAMFIETTVAKLESGGPRYAAMLVGAKQRVKELVNPYLQINFKETV